MNKQYIIKMNQLGLADLHVHSCLSPCADLNMSPKNIVKNAIERGLKIVALTDHNSSQNCPVFKKECDRHGIQPLFGMELNTKEEIHVLCITDDLEKALDFDEVVNQRIQKIENKPHVLGDQPVVNEKNEIIYQVPYYLGSAVDISVDLIFDYLEAESWLIIPSHVDRRRYSVISQLGFIPDLPFDAIEISGKDTGVFKKNENIEEWTIKTEYQIYPIVRNSDLHNIAFL